MVRDFLRFVAVFVLVASFVATPFVDARQANTTDKTPEPLPQQYLVLKNGAFFLGRIEKLENDTAIHAKSGSRILIPNEKVDFICENLVDAYWQRCARTKANDVEGQIALFHWCVKYQLLDQAQNQIDILQHSTIKATKLEYLHRQLQISEEQLIAKAKAKLKKTPVESVANKTALANANLKPPRPTESNQIQTVQLPDNSVENDTLDSQMVIRALPPINGTSTTATPRSSATNLQSSNGQVAQVAFNQPVEKSDLKVDLSKFRSAVDDPKTETPVAVTAPKRDLATISELEDLTKSLPKGAVATFKRKIEPGIIRSCFTAGCHTSDKADMPLMKLGNAKTMPRRLSQRNLYSILHYADADEPLKSRLLKAATTPHGGMAKAPISANSIQAQRLTNWLIQVSNDPQTHWQRLLIEQQAAAAASSDSADKVQQDFSRAAETKPTSTQNPFDPGAFNRGFGDSQSKKVGKQKER